MPPHWKLLESHHLQLIQTRTRHRSRSQKQRQVNQKVKRKRLPVVHHLVHRNLFRQSHCSVVLPRDKLICSRMGQKCWSRCVAYVYSLSAASHPNCCLVPIKFSQHLVPYGRCRVVVPTRCRHSLEGGLRELMPLLYLPSNKSEDALGP